eukprot:5333000-Pleurochrysis_carterae.AAC.2
MQQREGKEDSLWAAFQKVRIGTVGTFEQEQESDGLGLACAFADGSLRVPGSGKQCRPRC